jgi:hypothetical protein
MFGGRLAGLAKSCADWEKILDASKFKIGVRKNGSCKNIKAKASNLEKD